jgi:hypothetical protein
MYEYVALFGSICMGFDKETMRKMFPNLAREVDFDDNRVGINSVRTDPPSGENASSGRFSRYSPDVIDFIRRCDTIEQAEEIIVYMEERGEIEERYADKLRTQLRTDGVRSFGSKKEHDYYIKRGEQ